MPTLAEMVTRIRKGLSVDVTYEAERIPEGLQRSAVRLMRDYNFPWTLRKEVFNGLTLGQQEYPWPAGFKKEESIRFHDTEEGSYTDPLLKRHGLILPPEDGVPRYYWMSNGSIVTDIALDASNLATTELHLWYQNIAWDATNQAWMLNQFEDILFTFAVLRLALELNKTELAGVWANIWASDERSLAIYLNELEFDNSVFFQREARINRVERYPIS